MFNVHVFIASWLISAQSELDVVSSGLRKLLTEPGALLAALLEIYRAITAVPEPIIGRVSVVTFKFTAVVISNK